MKLTRIAVSDFRKLKRTVIEGLGPGLNVIVGDNEAGKSTLLAATRAALFERHRVTGRAVDEMLPYGHDVRPTVEVDFDKDGVGYRLRKAFAQRPEAELVGAGRAWSGDAADDELARLLGFTRPGRGESKPEEHQGIFGLLWVAQGTAHHGLGLGAGREHLASALEREVGEVTGGERGRTLLARAAERQAKFWDRSGKPRGDYRKAIAELEALRSQRQGVDAQLRAIDEEVDELGRIAARLERYEAEGNLEVAKAAVFETERALASIRELQQQARGAADALQLARLQHESAQRAAADRQGLIQSSRSASLSLAEARQAEDDAQSLLKRLSVTAEGARAEAERTASIERAAGERLRQLRADDASHQLRDGLERLQRQLAAAEEAERKRLLALANVSEARISAEEVRRLDALATALGNAISHLQAASVRLRLRPEAGARVLAGDMPVVGDELILSQDTTLHLSGFGEIEVRPGGGIEGLQRAEAEARRQLHDALRALQLVDIEAAHAALERRKSAEAEARLQAENLKTLAPGGIAALREEFASLKARAELLPEAAALGSPEAAEAAARGLEQAVAAAGRSREALEQAKARAHQAQTGAAVAADRAQAAQQLLQRAQDALALSRTSAADDELDLAVQNANAALEAAGLAAATARTALEAAEPEVAQLRLTRAQKAAEAIADDIRKLRDSRLTLEASLRTRGQQGLGEQLAELDGQIVYRQTQLDRDTLEANAAALLHEQLAAAQRETKERWLRPVQDSVAPYLNLLSAGSSVELDEDSLELSGVRRNDIVEPFSGLSMGAREQMAVITRLALADILREGGQSSCVVLDDALVNADEARLERMHLVLHKAAQNQQILILTCRERDFLDLGAPIFRM